MATAVSRSMRCFNRHRVEGLASVSTREVAVCRAIPPLLVISKPLKSATTRRRLTGENTLEVW